MTKEQAMALRKLVEPYMSKPASVWLQFNMYDIAFDSIEMFLESLEIQPTADDIPALHMALFVNTELVGIVTDKYAWREDSGGYNEE